MIDITGFDWLRAIVATVILSFITAFMVMISHLFFPIEIGSPHSLLALFSVCLLGGCMVLLFVRRGVQEHQRIMRHILDEITDVIVVKDFEGNFVFCNETVARLYKSSPEKMVGKDDFHFTGNKEQADFFRENVQSIMRRFEKEDVYESSTDANTGETRHFQSLKIPFRDRKNKLKIVVIAKDITDITRLKEEATRNKARLEHVLDVSEECLWEWNVQTNEVLHNRQWERITGIERSDNTFSEFENCILPEDRDKVGQALKMLLKHNQPYNIEFRMKRPDGRVIWIWDRGRVAEYDSDNNPVWMVGIAQDITTQKKNQ